MNQRKSKVSVIQPRAAFVLALAFVAVGAPACGGAVGSGVAVGRAGRDLSGHAHAAPEGALVCALKEAVAAPPGSDKPPSESCNKVAKADELWRRSMVVLSAYGETLEEIASGGGDSAGQVEAARTGVGAGEWIDVDGGPEKAAREADEKLVALMGAGGSKDLGRLIKDAAPHVKTVCDGLGNYLEQQAKGLADVQRDIEKKRATHADRRCGVLDTRSICVQESVIDRIVYAGVYGHGGAMESGHVAARDAVLGFCAAHKKLEEAAANGNLSKDRTVTDVADAMKSAHKAPEKPAGKPSKK